MRAFVSRSGLTNRFSLWVTVAIVAVVVVLGVYFDTFLKQSFLDNNRSRLMHGFQRLAYNIQTIETQLSEGTAFVGGDEHLIASIALINNYQDKQNYNAFLLDEEKKSIAAELLSRVKLSFNDAIALYDRNGELIAAVMQKEGVYQLQYVSYEAGEMQLLSRSEGDDFYRVIPVVEPQVASEAAHVHGDVTLIRSIDAAPSTGHLLGYHVIDGQVALRSQQWVADEQGQGLLAYVELTRVLDEDYFTSLSRDLDIQISAGFEGDYARFAQLLDSNLEAQQLRVEQSIDAYLAVMQVNSHDGPIYFVARLNKTLINQMLQVNQRQFLFLLVVVAGVTLLLMRSLIHHQLAKPLDILMRQIHKIEHQDYTQSSPVETADELGVISRNVNQLAQTVQEREASLRKSQDELEYLSAHDPLTDLPNRRFFAMRLQHALDLANRSATSFAVLFLDLDQFKLVNDTLGHNVGDELLLQVSGRLVAHVRRADTLARIGGDEFNILLENVQGTNEVKEFAEKVLELFHTPFVCNESSISTTVSIGIALYPQDGRDSVTLIKHADLAMYRSKEGGHNSYSFFSDELSQRLKERTEKTRALKEAIQTGEQFSLLYQPKIAISSHRIVGCEALIRWHSPEYGFVRPDRFIALAEETGLIIPIGEWVLERACTDFMRLAEEGVELDHVSINLSNVQLQHSDMIATLEQTMARTGISATKVELEITESYIATDLREALDTLQRFRGMNIRLAVDDFGTGYSSMSYLQRLPITRIKIDKSFVDGLPDNPESVAITRAIIALAKAMKLAITAEGVESAEQLAFLEGEQCDEIQGYYYARPLTLEQLRDFALESDYRIIA